MKKISQLLKLEQFLEENILKNEYKKKKEIIKKKPKK